MPETTPLIKAALNLRVGAGFDVYEKTGEVQVLPQNKSYISVINNYSMIVATRPDPTVRPPSRIHWK